jgi:hypothetical protein
MADIINRLNVGQTVNVKLTDSAVTNGQNLVDAYNYAKTLTPNGAALSATNRVSVIIQPGNYTLAAQLAVDTQFVDLIGLGSIKLRRGATPAVIIGGNNLNVTANDVRVKGISVGTQSFTVGNNLTLQIFEDCVGGNNSFNNTTVSGTFINCTGESNSFASNSLGSSTANGTFINCQGGTSSFGSGGSGSVASGLFVNCICSGAGVNGGFGGGNLASGTFIDCESTSTNGGFGGRTGGGISGTASGTFTNCIGGPTSFGGGSGSTATGKFYQCRLTSASSTFQTVTGTGLMRECIDGNNNIVNQ